MTMPEITIMGATAYDAQETEVARRIMAACDALQGADMYVLRTNHDLRRFAGVAARHASYTVGAYLAKRGYAYKTQTSEKTSRPGVWLWGHPDAIRIARERGY